jgi:hypothetical protein
MRGRIVWAALCACSVVVSLAAGGLSPRHGSPLWLEAEELAWELPGARAPTSEEHAILLEALALPGLTASVSDLVAGRSPAARLGALVHGDEAALSAREAVGVLAGLRVPAVPAKDLPAPVARKAAQAFARSEAGRAEKALAGGTKASALRAWIRGVARRAAAAAPGEGLPEALHPVVSPDTLARALAGDEKARVASWGEFRALAWARRAIRAGLRARVDTAFTRAVESMKKYRLPMKVRIRPGPGESAEGLVISLLGGRLGTATTDAQGRARMEAGMADLARVARGQGLVALQVVQQRREVLRRELPVERFLEAGKGLDLGTLELAPARGRLLIEVPGWDRLLAGQVEDAAPVKGVIRVGGAMRPESLGRDGRAVVPSLMPGLHLVSLAGQDESGTVVQRAFGVVEVPAGGEVVCTMNLPIEDVPEPVKRTKVAQVREDLAGLAARYKAGRIPRAAFRRTVGSIYRIHRAVTGDAKKDAAFAQEVRVAMQAAFQSVLPEAVTGGDPGPGLSELEASVEEVAEILPEFLRGERPAGRLDEYLQVEVGAAFAAEEGSFRSIRHWRADLRRSRNAAEEVAGIRELVTGVVAPRLEKLTATLRKQAESYRDGYTHFHLAGMDYEDRFLELAGAQLDPLRELVRRAEQLSRDHVVEDLRARVEAEAASVEAAAVRLRSQGKRWEALRARLEELRKKLKKSTSRPPELPFGGEALVARAAEGELPGAAILRDLGVKGSPGDALAKAAATVSRRAPTERALARTSALREALDGRLRAELVAAYERGAEAEALDELAKLAPTQRRKLLAQHTSGLYEKLAAPAPEAPRWVRSNTVARENLRTAVLAHDAQRRAVAAYRKARAEELARFEAGAPSLEELEAWRGKAREDAPSARWGPGGLGAELVARWDALAEGARERASAAATAATTAAPSN